MSKFWYRYVDWPTAAPLDEWGDPIHSGGVHVHCKQYPVLKETPQGVWLQLSALYVNDELKKDRRWVKRDARKRFACPTKEEALESFRARKRKQASIYRARANYADRALAKAEREFGNKKHADFMELGVA